MTIASADAKIAFTAQLYELEFIANYGKTTSGGVLTPEAGYAQAGVALKDLAQYEDWAGSWLGPALGGYESKTNLVRRFTAVRNKFKAKIPTSPQMELVNRVINKTPTPNAMGAKTCEEDQAQAAIDKFGPFYGRFPGAQLLTCHKKKIIVIGSVVTILTVLAVLSPYANLLNAVVKRKKTK